MCHVHDVAEAGDLVLQDHVVADAKAREHLVDKRLVDLPVGTAVEKNRVLAGGVHLNDGVSGRHLAAADVPDVNAGLAAHVQKKVALWPHHSGKPHLRAGPREGDGLVEPLAARVHGASARGERLPRRDHVAHAVDVVDVEGPKVKYARHATSSSLSPSMHLFYVGL